MTATIRQPLHNAAQSREADAIAAQSLGLVGIELMMRAGRAACDDLLQAWPEARRVTDEFRKQLEVRIPRNRHRKRDLVDQLKRVWQ